MAGSTGVDGGVEDRRPRRQSFARGRRRPRVIRFLVSAVCPTSRRDNSAASCWAHRNLRQIGTRFPPQAIPDLPRATDEVKDLLPEAGADGTGLVSPARDPPLG